MSSVHERTARFLNPIGRRRKEIVTPEGVALTMFPCVSMTSIWQVSPPLAPRRASVASKAMWIRVFATGMVPLLTLFVAMESVMAGGLSLSASFASFKIRA